LSDLLLHVADASAPEVEGQIEAVRRVLEEIGAAHMPEVVALNKIDRLRGSERARLATRFPGSVPVSAITGEGVEGLLEAVGTATRDHGVGVLPAGGREAERQQVQPGDERDLREDARER